MVVVVVVWGWCECEDELIVEAQQRQTTVASSLQAETGEQPSRAPLALGLSLSLPLSLSHLWPGQIHSPRRAGFFFLYFLRIFTLFFRKLRRMKRELPAWSWLAGLHKLVQAADLPNELLHFVQFRRLERGPPIQSIHSRCSDALAWQRACKQGGSAARADAVPSAHALRLRRQQLHLQYAGTHAPSLVVLARIHPSIPLIHRN